MRKKFLLFLSLLLTTCIGVPDNVKVIENIEASKYLGTWYEIARLDHSFEKDLEKVTATYSMRKDGSIKVVNRGFNANTNKWKDAEGKAYFIDPPNADNSNTGRLKVSFFGPFYASYNIIELDQPNYNYVMICGPDKSYLWVLSRTPLLANKVKQNLIAKAKSLGFDTDQLIYVTH